MTNLSENELVEIVLIPPQTPGGIDDEDVEWLCKECVEVIPNETLDDHIATKHHGNVITVISTKVAALWSRSKIPVPSHSESGSRKTHENALELFW